MAARWAFAFSRVQPGGETADARRATRRGASVVRGAIGDEIFGADRDGDVEGAADVDAEEARGRRRRRSRTGGLRPRWCPGRERPGRRARAARMRSASTTAGDAQAGVSSAGPRTRPRSGAHADGVEERPADPEAFGVARFAARSEVDAIRAPHRELREGLLLGAKTVPDRGGQLGPADPRSCRSAPRRSARCGRCTAPRAVRRAAAEGAPRREAGRWPCSRRCRARARGSRRAAKTGSSRRRRAP